MSHSQVTAAVAEASAAKLRDVQEELQQVQEQLNQIGENVSEAFFLATRDWQTAIYVSPAFERIWGMDRKTVFKDPKKILKVVHPEDRPAMEASMQRRARGEEHQTVEMDHRILLRDGTIRWLRSTVNPVRNAQGEVYRIAGTTRDITEQKQAEQQLRESEHRFRTIFEQAAVGVAMVDTLSGRFVRINERYSQIVGYSEDELTRKTFTEISLPGELPEEIDNMQRFYDGAVREFDLEKRLVHRDGKVVWVHLTVSAMGVAGAPPRHMIAIVQDITRRKEAEDALHETEQQLAHVARLSTVGAMVASIAHEVNQPLHAIATFSEACQTALQDTSNDNSEKVAEWLRDILKAAVQAGDIVRRLKGFGSRAEKACTRFPLRELIEDSFKLIHFEANRKSISLTYKLPNREIELTADLLQIQQVLVNLLRNAIEAVEDLPLADRWINLAVQDEPDSICLQLVDGGQGLDIEEDQAFEPFVTSKPAGLGLGLAISRSIIEAHGGQLWSKINDQGQTVFQFNLPKR